MFAGSAGADAGKKLHAEDGFSVEDFTGGDHGQHPGERYHAHFNGLVVFGLGRAGVDAAREKDLHGLGQEAGTGVVADELAPAAGAVACFFDEFATGGGERRFAFVNAASGQLQQILTGGVAVLPLNQHQRVIGIFGIFGFIHGEDDDRAVVADDIAHRADAVWLLDIFRDDGKNFAAPGDGAFVDVGLADFRAAGFLRVIGLRYHRKGS